MGESPGEDATHDHGCTSQPLKALSNLALAGSSGKPPVETLKASYSIFVIDTILVSKKYHYGMGTSLKVYTHRTQNPWLAYDC